MKQVLFNLIPLFTFLLISPHEKPVVTFINPVAHKIVLAGNFGELRNSHFHAGLDIKPSSPNREGDAILSVAEGHVSRIKIDRGGYGRAIYIDHPNGYTSVYGHLSGLNDALTAYVKNLQLQFLSYEIDVYPEANSLTVKQGEIIGRLGSSGISHGAHLHFEIRETQTETPVNPMIFGIKGIDTQAPVIASCTVHGLDIHMHTIFSQKLTPFRSKAGESKILELEVPAWRAGLSIYSFDRMNGANNKNGIYSLKMTVDDTVYYQFNVDKVAFPESRRINAHTDYIIKQKSSISEILCYQLPGNDLSFISTSINRGMINLYASKPRLVKIEVGDIDGNTTTQYLSLTRRLDMVTASPQPFQKWLTQGIPDSFYMDGLGICLGKKCLPYDLPLNINVDSTSETTTYDIGSSSLPLLEDIKVYFPLEENENSILVMRKGKRIVAPKYEIVNGKYVAYISEFGRYQFYTDTVPPSIVAVHFPPRPKSNSMMRFYLKDNVKPKSKNLDMKYNVWIDHVWYPCEYRSMSEVLYVPVFADGQSHHVLIETIDFSGNKAEWSGEYLSGI